MSWKCLISRFVEDVNTRRLYFSFPEIWYILLEFNSRKICQHLTNWTSWNESDKVWSGTNSLLKWRFRQFFIEAGGGPYDRNIFCARVDGPKPEKGKNLNHTQKNLITKINNMYCLCIEDQLIKTVKLPSDIFLPSITCQEFAWKMDIESPEWPAVFQLILYTFFQGYWPEVDDSSPTTNFQQWLQANASLSLWQ